MANTIKSWAKATAAGDPERVKSVQRAVSSGTTDSPASITVVWLGVHLALISWPWGRKDVIVARSPRHDTDAVRSARLRLLPMIAGKLPNRLTGRELDEVIVAASRADDVWPAVLAEEERKLAAADAAKIAEENRQRNMTKRRVVLLTSMLRERREDPTAVKHERETAEEWLAEILEGRS